MFDLDEYNDKDRVLIRFDYVLRDDEGRTISTVQRAIRGEEAEYLPEILNAFRLFLQGMTFTYIDNVIATSEAGIEHSADDIFG